jgi:hypothetical protein
MVIPSHDEGVNLPGKLALNYQIHIGREEQTQTPWTEKFGEFRT